MFLLSGTFGPLSDEVLARIEAIDDTEQLSELIGRTLDVRSLDEMGL